MRKNFYIIEAYTRMSIWDDFLLNHASKLPTKPVGWNTRLHDIPEGDYTVGHGIFYWFGSGSLCADAGIRKPEFEELPVIFCVTIEGVEEQCNVTAEQAADFIRARIC